MNRHNKRQHAVAVLSAVLAASGLALAPAAFAAKTPNVSEWKCEDFIAMEEVYKPKILYWASSQARGGSSDHETLDIERVEKMIPLVMEDCQKEPKANFLKKVKRHMGGY